jgi:hypothetical protein
MEPNRNAASGCPIHAIGFKRRSQNPVKLEQELNIVTDSPIIGRLARRSDLKREFSHGEVLPLHPLPLSISQRALKFGIQLLAGNF